MILYEVLVPTVRNNGKPYRTRHHREWDKQVRRITNGLTIQAPAKGQWVSPSGDLFIERMIPVRIIATKEQILEVLRLTFKHYSDQLAILCFKVSDEAIIYHRDQM